MTDRECVELLQWALPRLGLRWRGFKNVRRQVCRRVAARAAELGLDARAYRARLEADEGERGELDALCYVTISRFYRDRALYDALRAELLPEVARAATAAGERTLHAWSAGCASGEEPYTLSILWELDLAERFSALELDVLATDFDPVVLARAERGVYESGSLRELPDAWRAEAFEERDGSLVVRSRFRRRLRFERRDVRAFTPLAPLHLVLCRNVAFTYFDEEAQRAFVARVLERLAPYGLLVVGNHEAIPQGAAGLEPHPASRFVYRRAG